MSGRLTDEFVERVRSESDIVSVVSGYVPMKKKETDTGAVALFIRKIPRHSPWCRIKAFFIALGAMRGGMSLSLFQ